MKRMIILAIIAGAASLGGVPLIPLPTPLAHASEAAASRTVTFVVENMTCALCPVTVKAAMESVAGVKSVVINLNAKSATVVFDPAAATPEAIAASSTNAGYPALVKG
jgi:mercuric ion binding protein